jgi:ribosomal protein S3
MREKLLTALEAHAKGHIEKHRINIEVYLTSPVGIGEHGDIIETIEKELDEMAKYQDHLEIIRKYFG